MFFSLASLSALLVIPCHPIHAQIAANERGSNNVLTQAVQVLSLSPEQANRNIPAKIRGTVTCWDVRTQLYFVQDSTAGIYLYYLGAPLSFDLGDVVEVFGTARLGLFSPIIIADKISFVGKGSLPPPKKVSIEQLVSGREDSQWVEIEGVIHKETKHWGHVVLDLVGGRNRLEMRLLNVATNADTAFTDAKVRVQGVAAARYNDKRQLIGFHLLIPSLKQIQIQEAPSADPFSLNLLDSRSLLSYSPQRSSEHRVHLRGVVTLHRPGKTLFIKDQSGGLLVRTVEQNRVDMGDVVDAVGFPAVGSYTPILEDAIFHVVGKQTPPAPVSITVTQASSGKFDNELIQMDGFLKSATLDGGLHRLVLEADRHPFQAEFDESGDAAQDPALQSGSKLRLTGICSVTVNESGKPESFSLSLRSSQDILVLERPPWWKRVRTNWVLGGLGTLLMLGLLWAGLTRIRVRQQTKVFRQRQADLERRYRDLVENANDIIFTCELSGKITSLNKAGERILGYSGDEVLRINIVNLVVPEQQEFIRKQLKAPLVGSSATHELVVQGKKGQRLILEVNTRPTCEKNTVSGVQGIARDVTARKHAEEALRQSEQQLRRSMEERERIGRDLHDNIIQSIYAVGLNLEDCRSLVMQHPADVELRLKKVLGDLNTTIREVRSFILGLESNSLKGSEFKTALKSLILTFGDASSARFCLEIDSHIAESLSPRQATHLLHIAREAMTNSVRHAAAQRTTLSLRPNEGGIRFEICDDGVGFDPDCLNGRGLGLRNMAARAEEIGAKFLLASQAGKGTQIVLDIPLETQHQSAPNEATPSLDS